MAPVEGGGGEGKRRGDRARWIGRSGALPGDASMRAMGIECGAEGGRGGDGIGQGMFGPVGLGLGGARLGHDANGPAWLLGCKAAGLLLSLYSFIFQNRKYQRGKEEERKCLG